MNCPYCKQKDHNKFCCSEKTNPNKSSAKSVRVRHIIVNKKIVRDDCKPTPTCNMNFKTNKGQEFSKEVLPQILDVRKQSFQKIW